MSDETTPVENTFAALGGKARAAKMTPEERSESAKKAADARWLAALPKATHIGELNLAGHTIACAVLEDGRRVLSTQAFIRAIGRTGNLKSATRTEDGDFFKTPVFLAADNLKPYVEQYLASASTAPISYRPTTGEKGYGYEAYLLPIVCNIYLAARRDKKLIHKQKKIAEACEVLLSALAQMGIDALVDEATGFQYVRQRDALQRLLERYISRELARWVHTFDADFYRLMYKLRKWDALDPDSNKRPSAVGKYTVDLVYDRIHPDLHKKLKATRAEWEQAGGEKWGKLHQFLTRSEGYPRLQAHLEGVKVLMKVSRSWEVFYDRMEMVYPRVNQTLRIPFPDPDDENESSG